MADGKPTVHSMLKDAITNLGGTVTHRQIIDWINGKYNDVNEGTVRAHINMSSVNMPGRVGMPENSKPREKIETCIIFVALRGGINTGKSDSSIDFGRRNVYGTFEEHLQTVLEWKKNPNEFIKELIEQPTQDSLHEAIKEKLVNDSK